MIRMLDHVPATKTGYDLEVKIFDRVFPTRDVVSTVKIFITDLPEEAPYRSGSVRLTGEITDSSANLCLSNYQNLASL